MTEQTSQATNEFSIDFGDLSTDTIVAQRPSVVTATSGPLAIFYKSVKGILGGMYLTLKYFVNPRTSVTQQYPENRDTLKMFDRYRGKLELIHEESGLHRCTACLICEKACPNASIIIKKGGKNAATGKVELDQFIWRQDICTFCNACVVVCPFDALEMTGDFESSVYDRRLLVYNLNEYTGPCASQLEKVEDDALAKEQVRPLSRYAGPVPMSGTAMDALPALHLPPVSTEEGSANDS